MESVETTDSPSTTATPASATTTQTAKSSDSQTGEAPQSSAAQTKEAAAKKSTSQPSSNSGEADGEAKWRGFGLGKGVDLTRSYKSSGFDDASLILDPVDDLCEILHDGVGRQDVKRTYDATIDNSSNASATIDSPALKWFTIDFGLDSLAHGRKRQFTHRVNGYQILTRTVAFAHASLLDPKRPLSLVETILDEKQKERGGGSESDRITICSDVIADERLGHATHFVHTIQLGAKRYDIYFDREVDDTKKTSASANAFCCGGGGAVTSSSSGVTAAAAATTTSAEAGATTTDGVAVTSSRFSLSINEPDGGGIHGSLTLGKTDSRSLVLQESRIIADPSVNMPPLSSAGSTHTSDDVNVTVTKNQELAIGFRLAPISVLIRDPAWKSAMEEALRNNHNKFLSTEGPLVQTKGPFILKAGKFFLKKDAENRLVTTDKLDDAARLYLEASHLSRISDVPSISVKGVTFRIIFRKDGIVEYLCLSTDNPIAHFSQIPPGPSFCSFALSDVASREHASLADWRHSQPKLIFRKTSVLKKRQYLSVFKPSPKARLSTKDQVELESSETEGLPVAGASNLQSNALLIAQFTLHNYAL